jgi:hypothetical protein
MAKQRIFGTKKAQCDRAAQFGARLAGQIVKN